MTFPRFKFPEPQKAAPPLATNATLRHEAGERDEKACAARVEAAAALSQVSDEGLRHDATFATFPRFSFPKSQSPEFTPAIFTACSMKVPSRVASVAESRNSTRENAAPEKPMKDGTLEPCGPEKRSKVAEVAKVAGPLSENATSGVRKVAKSQKSQGVTPENEKSRAVGLLAEWRSEVALVKPNKPEIEKLKTESLRFLDGRDAIAAVENGWDAVSLFGMHEGDAPKERIDCWGVVLFLAWGVHSCTVETVDQKVCALRTRSGAVQTLRRSRANFDQAIPWWRHPGITNAI